MLARPLNSSFGLQKMNWKHPYNFIKSITEKILLPKGYVVDFEQLNPDVFGSAFCIFKKENEKSFRLVWDGKDGWGFIQVPEKRGWKDLSIFLTEGDIEGESINYQKVNDFMKVVEINA